MVSTGTVPGVPVTDPHKTHPWPGMTFDAYRRLVARKGQQVWTAEDEERLRDKVRRIRRA